MLNIQLAMCILIPLSDFGERCVYHDCIAGQEVVFSYNVLNNVDSRKGEITRPMNYYPDVALQAYDSAGAELQYVQMERAGNVTIMPRETGEIRVCMKSLNSRQKMQFFLFDVRFEDAQTRKQEADFALGGVIQLRLQQSAAQVDEIAREQTDLRFSADIEGASKRMERAFIAATLTFLGAYIVFNLWFIRRTKRHLKEVKL